MQKCSMRTNIAILDPKESCQPCPCDPPYCCMLIKQRGAVLATIF